MNEPKCKRGEAAERRSRARFCARALDEKNIRKKNVCGQTNTSILIIGLSKHQLQQEISGLTCRTKLWETC